MDLSQPSGYSRLQRLVASTRHRNPSRPSRPHERPGPSWLSPIFAIGNVDISLHWHRQAERRAALKTIQLLSSHVCMPIQPGKTRAALSHDWPIIAMSIHTSKDSGATCSVRGQPAALRPHWPKRLLPMHGRRPACWAAVGRRR